MNSKLVLIILIGGISGCASLIHPQNAAEYRARMPESYTEKFEVKRPYRMVSDTLKKKSAQCLNVSMTKQWMEPQGRYSIPMQQKLTYRSAVRVTATKAELQLQLDDGTRGGLQKVPEGGMYILVVDAYPAGGDRTRVEIYGGGDHVFGPIAEGVKNWATGKSMACPKLD